jgi:hypothetical protein
MPKVTVNGEAEPIVNIYPASKGILGQHLETSRKHTNICEAKNGVHDD